MEDIDKYRFTSGEEPTDEMLSQIMREAAQEARESRLRAEENYRKTFAATYQKIRQQCGLDATTMCNEEAASYGTLLSE